MLYNVNMEYKTNKNTENNKIMPRTGKSVGYDFGLKTFFTASDGNDVKSPEFLKHKPNCGDLHHRDRNAAVNIHRVGASTLGVDTVRPAPVG